jgi:hypothetical protein
MLDVEVDHVAIGEQLHQGRHDEEEAELLVPQDLDEFLDDDMPDAAPHILVSSEPGAVSRIINEAIQLLLFSLN